MVTRFIRNNITIDVLDFHLFVLDFNPVSRARSKSGPGVLAGSRTMQISNITDAISKFVHITHECMDSKQLTV